jgi:hypothetical protein
VKLVGPRRPKITYSPSYVDVGPKTNGVILSDMDHTLKGDPGKDWEREGNHKLECG